MYTLFLDYFFVFLLFFVIFDFSIYICGIQKINMDYMEVYNKIQCIHVK